MKPVDAPAIDRCAGLFRTDEGVPAAVRRALEWSGILDRVSPGARVALKPNLTYPWYKPGVTTSPEIVRETVRLLRERGAGVAIVESDGGYGAWNAWEAFKGHGLDQIAKETGAELVNLCEEDKEPISFRARGRTYQLPMPVRLLRHTDLFITMPVPKIHAMTGITLAFKNQWGCVPDNMRLRRHYIFNEAIVAINRALKPAVLSDGTWFLDRQGPMDGDAVRMDLILAASDPGAFDLYVSTLMGYPWRRVAHMRRAVRLGEMPDSLDAIRFNVDPREARGRVFRLERSPRNYIALAGFSSRFLTWFGYESWFGRIVLHGILYAIVGKPVGPRQAG